ncbi:hypothetical protein PLICRDRAFT_47049 [Plicaturopsis crispa FD-325 SS-3]|uniref:VHS domain-containing protein n=1 Tax=Plicaturopsis crispa FD-325 SS-3 TaxID=944288 RepID=A0A0C9SWQ4_PLICR|nr:hypothetical protein PLICRDRAFT_47049 [Plicaturopsis crispa FD-325 SS-3]
MKKLFGKDKPKMAKVVSGNMSEDPHPIYSMQSRDAVLGGASMDEDRWEVVSTLSESHLQPSQRPPLNTNQAPRDRGRDTAHKKKTPPAPGPLGILAALEPRPAILLSESREGRGHSEERMTQSDYSHRDEKKEKKAFWGHRDKERERERERHLERERERQREAERQRESERHNDQERQRERGFDHMQESEPDRGKDKDRENDRWKEKYKRDDDNPAELTRMIGWLTATSSEDWALVLEVCERASASDTCAKEAVRALRREFKYAEPSAQLAAARLWAIMLRNCSDVFIAQNTSRKFMDTLEDVLTSPRTTPVVKDRLMDVLAAAAFASTSPKSKDTKESFKSLWKRVKPVGLPDEGIPFDTEDSMFNPPMPRSSQHVGGATGFMDRQLSQTDQVQPTAKRKSSFSKHRIIPPDEDIRRLFQECKIGKGNASLLSEALAFARPEDLTRKEIIKEFYTKCRASQELIYAQIPWASAGAEHSRLANGRPDRNPGHDTSPVELTVEEKLLAALLEANEDLLEALRVYDDLERLAVERDVEKMSRNEVKMDRSRLRYNDDGTGYLEPSHTHYGGSSSSRSTSPAPSNSPELPSHTYTHRLPRIPPSLPSHTGTASSQHLALQAAQTAALAPPPPAPHGPRSPGLVSSSSRTSSPVSDGASRSNSADSHFREQLHNGLERLHFASSHQQVDDEEVLTPVKPSAKALGKRKVVVTDQPEAFDTDEMFYEHRDMSSQREESLADSDSDEYRRPHHQPVRYAYDAWAEQQRIREGHSLVSGVH